MAPQEQVFPEDYICCKKLFARIEKNCACPRCSGPTRRMPKISTIEFPELITNAVQGEADAKEKAKQAVESCQESQKEKP